MRIREPVPTQITQDTSPYTMWEDYCPHLFLLPMAILIARRPSESLAGLAATTPLSSTPQDRRDGDVARADTHQVRLPHPRKSQPLLPHTSRVWSWQSGGQRSSKAFLPGTGGRQYERLPPRGTPRRRSVLISTE